MEQIFHEAGVPSDTYVNIFATSDQIAWVVADPRVHGVSLTGSERAGAAVAEIAGRNLKKVLLEVGGADPFIVLNTADMDSTVQQAVRPAGESRPGPERGSRRAVLWPVPTHRTAVEQQPTGPSLVR